MSKELQKEGVLTDQEKSPYNSDSKRGPVVIDGEYTISEEPSSEQPSKSLGESEQPNGCLNAAAKGCLGLTIGLTAAAVAKGAPVAGKVGLVGLKAAWWTVVHAFKPEPKTPPVYEFLQFCANLFVWSALILLVQNAINKLSNTQNDLPTFLERYQALAPATMPIISLYALNRALRGKLPPPIRNIITYGFVIPSVAEISFNLAQNNPPPPATPLLFRVMGQIFNTVQNGSISLNTPGYLLDTIPTTYYHFIATLLQPTGDSFQIMGVRALAVGIGAALAYFGSANILGHFGAEVLGQRANN